MWVFTYPDINFRLFETFARVEILLEGKAKSHGNRDDCMDAGVRAMHGAIAKFMFYKWPIEYDFNDEFEGNITRAKVSI